MASSRLLAVDESQHRNDKNALLRRYMILHDFIIINL